MYEEDLNVVRMMPTSVRTHTHTHVEAHASIYKHTKTCVHNACGKTKPVDSHAFPNTTGNEIDSPCPSDSESSKVPDDTSRPTLKSPTFPEDDARTVPSYSPATSSSTTGSCGKSSSVRRGSKLKSSASRARALVAAARDADGGLDTPPAVGRSGMVRECTTHTHFTCMRV